MRKLLLALLLFALPFIAGAQCTTNNSTTCVCKDGGTDCDLLPDIIVGRPPLLVNGTNGYIEYPPTCPSGCSGNEGRLRISVSSPNIGLGPLEVHALNTIICGTDTFFNPAAGFTCPNGDPLKQLVVQRVYHKSGSTMTYYDRPAGSMTYHPSHGHMHVDDWGIYTLRSSTSNPDPLTWPIIGTGSKLAFCLMDYGSCSTYNGHCVDSAGNILTNSNFPNYGLGGGSFGCSPVVQGISSGYTDIYYQALDGMWINLPPGLCNGQYWVVVQLDPKGYFMESNENNNVIAISVNLTQQNGVTPVISANGPTTFCQGGNVTLTCNAASTYAWSNGATTQSIFVTQSGNYSVSVNSTSTCPAVSQPVQVTAEPVVVAPSATPSTICSGSATQLNSNVTSTGVYTQSAAFINTTAVAIPDNNPVGASSVINISGLSPTTLNANSIVSVKVNLTHTYDGDLIIQLISPSGNTINLSNRRGGSGDNFTNTIFIGNASTVISAGTAPFTGSYLPEASFSALTGNLNGAWTLKVVDQSGTDSGTLLNWTLTLNKNVATSLSYAWTSTPAGFTSTSATPTVSPTASTTYSVVVNESGTGCSGSGNIAVTVKNPVHVAVNTPAPLCAGSATTLTATGADTYVWSPATGLNTTTGASVIATPTQTTTYKVVGSNGACTDSTTVTVNVNSLPLVNVNTANPVCAGSSATLTANGADTYSWSPATGLNATAGASVIATPSQTATYIVTGTGANGCTASASTTVTVNPYPTTSVSGLTTICSGNSTTLTASGADTYVWTPSDGLNTTTATVVTASPLVTTNYTLRGVKNGCTAAIGFIVTVLNKPEAPVKVYGLSFGCAPLTNVSFHVDPVLNATTYNWTLPAGMTIVSGSGTSSILVNIAQGAEGDVCVTAGNTCGVSAAACLHSTIYFGTPAQLGVITSSAAKVCPGDVITYSVPTASNIKVYFWTVPAGMTIVSGQNTNTITALIDNSFTGGTMNVKGRNTCATGAPRYKTIILNTAPATPGNITGNAQGVCQSTEIYSVPLKAGQTYTWTAPANATVLSGQGTNTVSIQYLSGFVSGNISVITLNGCGISSARTKAATAVPRPAVSVSGPTSVCTGQNGVTFSTPLIPGASSYLWTVPANAGTIISGQGTNTITVNFGTTPRSFNVNVKGVNTCGSSLGKVLAVSSSNCTKVVDFASTGSALNLHPNPATDFVEVIYNTDITANAELNITNILGQNQYKQSISPDKGSNSFMIDLRKYPAGVYMISIIQEDRTFTQRLVIQ